MDEIVLPLIGFKIEIPRKVKPFMSWNDAEKVISLSNVEYQNVFRVMLWGIDRERFIQLNKDKRRLDAVSTQLNSRLRVSRTKEYRRAHYEIARLTFVLR